LFNLSNISKRYFGVEIGDVKIEVEPPKLKTLRRLEKLRTNSDSAIDEIVSVLSIILSKNKTGYKISEDFVEETFNTDEMKAMLEVYFNWVSEIEKSPN